MSTSTLKELIKPSNTVHFRRCFDGQLWYQVYEHPTADNNLIYSRPIGPEFPVPISDIGSATFLASDRAVLFMRYIRKYLAAIKEAKAAQP